MIARGVLLGLGLADVQCRARAPEVLEHPMGTVRGRAI